MSPAQDLERAYDQHAGSLFALLLNITRNQSDARDLLQEVFLKLARNPNWSQGVRDERAFLIRLTANLATDAGRRRATRDQSHDSMSADRIELFEPSANPDEAHFRASLTSALAELPLEQRTVVHLKLWEGMTFEAIAEALDIPANTAASRYRYGIDKLRAALRPLYEEL